MAFGPRCNPGTPSLIGLPKWPPCPGCCLAQHSNLELGLGPEMRIPAPLRCGEGKGHPEQCCRIWLHAHENHGRKWLHAHENQGPRRPLTRAILCPCYRRLKGTSRVLLAHPSAKQHTLRIDPHQRLAGKRTDSPQSQQIRTDVLCSQESLAVTQHARAEAFLVSCCHTKVLDTILHSLLGPLSCLPGAPHAV